MITDHMTLKSTRDADTWAGQFGLECEEQEQRVSAWIWENKPHYGCTWSEFRAANSEILESEAFWEIAGECPGAAGGQS